LHPSSTQAPADAPPAGNDHFFPMATKRATKRSRTPKRAAGRYWSKRVMETSDALDLQNGVFKLPPKKMASSLKRSAERSGRRKSAPLRSAMSMLSFYEKPRRPQAARLAQAQDRPGQARI